MTIVEFIEARLAVDLSRGSWYDMGAPIDGVVHAIYAPERITHQVAALRAVVALHEPFEYNDVTGTDACVICESSGADAEPYWPCATVRHVAAIWSDHVDYVEAWEA